MGFFPGGAGVKMSAFARPSALAASRAVGQAAGVLLAAVGAEGEPGPGGLRHLQERHAGQPRLAADLDGHVVLDGGVDDPPHSRLGPQGVVLGLQDAGQGGGGGKDVDRFAFHLPGRELRVPVHEVLLVVDLDLLGLPEFDAAAVLLDERQGVGQDEVQFGHRLLREDRHPVDALGLDALVDALALEHGHVLPQVVVVAQDHRVLVLLGAGVLDDAVLAAPLLGVLDRPVDGHAVEVDMVIDDGEVEVGGVGGLGGGVSGQARPGGGGGAIGGAGRRTLQY